MKDKLSTEAWMGLMAFFGIIIGLYCAGFWR